MHRIHESDSNFEKEKNIFRIILEKGDMSELLLEPRYQNTRKEEREREREYEFFPTFHFVRPSAIHSWQISLEESSGDGPLVAMAIILLCAAT